uniref:Methyltransferase-like protein 13 n=1 Tax=Haemonchus contortus TaxID=6289 RepID=A0A7I4YEI8_HAECO
MSSYLTAEASHLVRLFIILAPGLLAAIYFYVHGNGSSKSETLSASKKITELDVVRQFLWKYGRYRVLERSICMDDATTCFDVRDNVGRTKNGRLYLYRSIFRDSFELTVMNLMIPENPNMRTLNTSKWQPNKTATNLNCYTPLMIEEMFVSGAVKMDREANSQILSIGLGAGYINSYLRSMYPKMNITVVEIESKMVNIAQKWFSLVLDDLHRVIVMDGIEFLRKAAMEERKFDVIHIDACTHAAKKPVESFVRCPVPGFFTPESVGNIFKILNKRGAVIMNLLSIGLPKEEVAETVLHNFKKFFEHCVVRDAEDSPPNMVATCSQNERLGNLKEEYDRFLKIAF